MKIVEIVDLHSYTVTRQRTALLPQKLMKLKGRTEVTERVSPKASIRTVTPGEKLKLRELFSLVLREVQI